MAYWLIYKKQRKQQYSNLTNMCVKICAVQSSDYVDSSLGLLLGILVKLQMNLFHIKVHVKVHLEVHLEVQNFILIIFHFPPRACYQSVAIPIESVVRTIVGQMPTIGTACANR